MRRVSARLRARKRQTSALRDQVLADSLGQCERGCRHGKAEEMDHVWGRAEGRPPQSRFNCWMLCSRCHRQKTANRPDRAHWIQLFADRCDRLAKRLHRRDPAAAQGFAQELAYAEQQLGYQLTKVELGAGERLSGEGGRP